MARRLSCGVVVGALMSVACGGELPSPPEPTAFALRFEPEAEPSAVTPSVRLHVDAWAHPAGLRLFQGALSDYHVGRVRSGELPATLLEREVPALAFAREAGVTSAPIELLAPGEYSLASPELGLIGSFSVAARGAPPVLTRLWPPERTMGTFAAYCGEQAPAGEAEVLLEPSATLAWVRAGLDQQGLLAERCVSLELERAPAPGTLNLPPPMVFDVLLDPEPLVAAQPAEQDIECQQAEVALGAGCATVADDRVLLRCAAPLLWLFHEPGPAVVPLARAGVHSLSGLEPGREVRLSGESVDVFGRRSPFSVQVRTKAPLARVVLNEVLANAAGAEPAAEWIELVNDGAAPAALGGFRLDDGAGSVLLPEVTLSAFGYALLVSERYVPDAALDVPPAAGSLLVVLPSLAKNGLSNGGEPLRLFDAAGALLSSFPSLAAKKAGVSLARRTPSTADDDSSGFGPHAAPGASPGAENTLASE